MKRDTKQGWHRNDFNERYLKRKAARKGIAANTATKNALREGGEWTKGEKQGNAAEAKKPRPD